MTLELQRLALRLRPHLPAAIRSQCRLSAMDDQLILYLRYGDPVSFVCASVCGAAASE